MKILKDDELLDFLERENESETGKLMPSRKNVDVEFSVKQIQIHIDYGCGCKITQDKKFNWLTPCKKHYVETCKFVGE